jgi:RNA polymerase sigma factor (sigma-70 family)
MSVPLACPASITLQYTAWMEDETAARTDDDTVRWQDEPLRQLMRAAQDGDRAAYDRLLRQIIPIVRACARRHCQNAADIEESVQESLLTVHRVRHTYDPRRPFLPWLTAIAVRRSIDGLRRRARIGRHEAAELSAFDLEETGELQDRNGTAQTADEAAEAASAGPRLAELLQRLPARQREALRMLKLQEMSLAEAALASGQTVGALKVNAHRALRRLRGLVSEDR